MHVIKRYFPWSLKWCMIDPVSVAVISLNSLSIGTFKKFVRDTHIIFCHLWKLRLLQLWCIWYSVSPKLWFRCRRTVVQPAICRADNVLVVRKSVSVHDFFQFRKQIEDIWKRGQRTCSHVSSGTGRHPSVTHRIRHSYPYTARQMAGWKTMNNNSSRLQQNQSFGDTLDQVHFSCMRPCWKVTKYDVRVSCS